MKPRTSNKKQLTDADIDKVFSEVLDRNPRYQDFLRRFGLKKLRDALKNRVGAMKP